MRWLPATSTVLLALLLVQPASSQLRQPQGGAESENDRREQRRAKLYTEGVTLADAGRWAEAVDKFRQVVEIRSAPQALFTLGQAEEKVGRLATAERTFERALADARAIKNTEVETASIRAIVTLAPRIPRLILRLDPKGPQVDSKSVSASVNDLPIALDTPVKLDPGDYLVSVRAPHRQLFQQKAALVPGRTFEVQVALLPEVEQPRPSPQSINTGSEPVDQVEQSPFPLGPVLVGSAGLVLAVVGLGLQTSGRSKYDEAATECNNGVCPRQSLVEEGNEGRTNIALGSILAGAGVLAAVSAGVWWALGTKQRTSSVSLQVAPSVRGGNGAQGTLRLQF